MTKSTQIHYLKRRKKFIRSLPENSLVVIPNKPPQIRSNDVEFKFKPDSDFFYLTGFEEPNSICIFRKDKKESKYILFCEEKNKEKERWIGKITGPSSAKSVYLANEAYPIAEFSNKLKKLTLGVDFIYYPLGINRDLDIKLTGLFQELRIQNRSGTKSPKAIFDPREIIHKMRLVKDNYEISLITKAAEITRNAHIFAIAYTKPGMFEHEVEAIIDFKFIAQGSLGPAYPSIVGSGDNSTILHYIKNNKKIKTNDLVLIDAGCEYNFYSSDLTRTFPANKKFTPAQKAIYEIVLESQLKAIEKVKPGMRFIDSYNTAVRVIVDGLKELKLLKGSTAEIIKKGKYKRFFMHRIGHWLGLDVHDAGPYLDECGASIKLQPGMVMTVEPGIYISKDLSDVPKEFRGIGIRIEDDVLITKKGNEVLTSEVPKTIEEIESLA